MTESDIKRYTVLGQKYAYATAALLLGIFSFVHVLGLEKAVLAIVFGWLALRASPGPKLALHRVWAQVGVGLAVVALILVPTVIILNFDRLKELIEALSKLSGGR